MANEYFSRSLDIFKAPKTPLHIVGVGAIGSMVALAAAKSGFSDITCYDFDSVDDVNVGLQMYGPKHIGLSKVLALQQIIYDLAGLSIKITPTKFEPSPTIEGYVFLCTDSMSSRSEVYNSLKTKFSVEKLIDLRMAGESLLAYTVSPWEHSEAEEYEKTLYSDSEAIQERCTAKGTIFTSLIAGGLAISLLKAIITKQEYKFMTMDIDKFHLVGVQRWKHNQNTT